MKVLVHLSAVDAKKVKESIALLFAHIESESWESDYEVVGFIHPGAFREIHDLVQKCSKGKGVVHTLSLKDVEEGEKIL